jgi:hypothetical protein
MLDILSSNFLMMTQLFMSKFEFTLRLTVNQSVSVSWCRAHSATSDQITLPVGRLLSASCGLISVGRPLCGERKGQQFAVQSLNGPSCAESQPYFTLSSETSPIWRARFPYLYPPGTGWSSYTPGHWVPFTSPLATRRATEEVF